MRFKKGSRVEVLTKKDIHSSAWRCGKIISGNGHTYSVRFDCPPGMSCRVERVTRKAMRLCPPPANGPCTWTPGDVVEVFDDFCWKKAAILKMMSGNYYLIKVFGSSRQLQLNKVNIRSRQMWENGQWIVIRKDSGSCDDVKSKKLIILNNCTKMSSQMLQSDAKMKMQRREICLDADYQESDILSTKALKRASPLWLSDAESCNQRAPKMRAVEKEGEHQRVVSRPQSLFLKKVDAVAYPQKFLGETCMHILHDNQTVGYYESRREIQNYCVEDFHARSLEPIGSDIDASSVGSCSVVCVNPGIPFRHILVRNNPDADAFSSDAESFYGREDEEETCFPLGEDVAAIIHRLELRAYRCTLNALYASGPLTWEQETLLTNLRMSLNISNDEHSVEIKSLISSGTSSQIR